MKFRLLACVRDIIILIITQSWNNQYIVLNPFMPERKSKMNMNEPMRQDLLQIIVRY